MARGLLEAALRSGKSMEPFSRIFCSEGKNLSDSGLGVGSVLTKKERF